MSSTNSCIGEQYFQTIKEKVNKIRKEYEIELLKPQYNALCDLCLDKSVSKKRYEISLKTEDVAFLDVYKNTNSGLYTVEVEFKTEKECDDFNPPEWFGEEVTHNRKYSNHNLALNPVKK